MKNTSLAASLLCSLFLLAGCAVESSESGDASGNANQPGGGSSVAAASGVNTMDAMDGGQAGGGAPSGGGGGHDAAGGDMAEAGYADMSEGYNGGIDESQNELQYQELMEQQYAERGTAETADGEDAARPEGYGEEGYPEGYGEAGYAGGEGAGYPDGYGEGGGAAKPPEFPPGSAENAAVKVVMAVASESEEELAALSQFIDEKAQGDILATLRKGEPSEEQLAEFKKLMGRVKPFKAGEIRGKYTVTFLNDKGQFLHFRCEKKGEEYKIVELDVVRARGR